MMRRRADPPVMVYPVRGEYWNDVTFTVVQGERVAYCLTFDKMLGELVRLTEPQLAGHARYMQDVDVLCDLMASRAKRREEQK